MYYAPPPAPKKLNQTSFDLACTDPTFTPLAPPKRTESFSDYFPSPRFTESYVQPPTPFRSVSNPPPFIFHFPSRKPATQ